MKYRYHHVGMLSTDVDSAADLYCEHFGHEIGPRAELPMFGDVQFVRATADVPLGLVSPPLESLPAELTSKGIGVAYLALSVDDLDEAIADLSDKGATVAWDPSSTSVGTTAGLFCGLYDLLVVLVQPDQDLQAKLTPVGKVGPLRFHHIAVITRDLGGVVHMFKDLFGFRVLAEWVEHGSGEIKIVDADYSDPDHYFLIEVLNPPQVAPSDLAVLERRGTSFHHLSYIADDVASVYKQLVDSGVTPSEDPIYYEQIGAAVSFLWDPDDNAIEVYRYDDESVISPALLAGAV